MQPGQNIAVLADIHANHHALARVISLCHQEGIRDFLVLGDLISDGAYPQRTMDLLYQLQKTDRCILVSGNREEYMLSYRRHQAGIWRYGSSATGSLLYTYQHLRQSDLDFLAALPGWGTYHDSEYSFQYCHGSMHSRSQLLEPGSQTARQALAECPYDLLAVGHTHCQNVFSWQGKRLVNPGSLGVPVDTDGRTQFLVLHRQEHGWQEELRQAEYDQAAAIRELQEAGLYEAAGVWANALEENLRCGRSRFMELISRACAISLAHGGSGSWQMISDEDARQAAAEMGLI